MVDVPKLSGALVCLISLFLFVSGLKLSDRCYAEAHKHTQGTSMHMPVVFGKQLSNNLLCVILYESQPVGLAEVIDASEASLGVPGGRAGKMSLNRVKQVVIMVFDLRVMYQVAIG